MLVLLPGGLSAEESTSIDLTDEEKAYLQSRSVLRLGVGTAAPPFMFVKGDGEDTVFQGIVSDYVDVLSRRLGIPMEPVLGISFIKAMEMGKRGDIDVFPGLAITPERLEHFVYTEPYLSYPLVIIARDDVAFIGTVDDLRGKTVATIKHLATYSKFVNDLPHVSMKFHFVQKIEDLLHAVSNGDADACVVNLAAASYFIAKNGWANLKVVAPTPWDQNKWAMAVPKDRAILASILQKGLNSISFEEANAIKQRWINLKTATFADPALVRQIAIQASITVIIIIALFIIWNRRLKYLIRERERIEMMRTDVERMIRHELRSPLSGFVSMCQILETSGKLPEELDSTVALGHRQAQTMLDIVSRQTDLFRMELGTYEPTLEAVDLDNLVREVADDMVDLGKNKGIELSFTPHVSNPVIVSGENGLIRIVATNLIRNAIEASREGDTVRITLSAAHQWGMFEIHNPASVPDTIKDRFFEKYATADKQNGTGLGTYAAKLFCEALGGKITMRTGSDGTCVKVFLPPPAA